MSDATAINERVLRIIAKACERDPGQIQPDATFAQLGLESLDAIEVVFDIESEFNIQVPDNVASQFNSVRDIVDGLNTLLSAQVSEQRA